MNARTLTITATTALCSLALATPASADSISFLRGGDIWVASPDGQQQVQVTRAGVYSYQSQADDGTFVALAGRRLHRLSRTGALLADFDTPVSGEKVDDTSSYFRSPFKPEISPDGTKVAYEYRWTEINNAPGCVPIGSPNCQRTRVHVGVGYSHADRQTSWDEPGLGRQSGWTEPSWIGNDTVMLSRLSVLPNLDVMLDRPGDGNQTLEGWFSDDSAWNLLDGEVSRRGDAMALVSTKPKSGADPDIGHSDDQVTIYRRTGAGSALPENCFSFHIRNATYESPTFSPDGGRLAFQNGRTNDPGNSIAVAAIPDLAGGCQLPAAGAQPLIENARQPDWGSAGMPAAPGPGSGQPGGGTPGGVPGGGRPAGGAPAKPVSVRVTLDRRSLKRALRSGFVVRYTAPAAGTVEATARRGQRTVARGSRRVATAGPTRIRLRFSAAARRSLARAHSARLVVRMTVRTP